MEQKENIKRGGGGLGGSGGGGTGIENQIEP